MRPFGARGSAGEARRLCGSAAGQNPLSLFPWKKRKRFLMVSREKGLAAAFRASPGTLAAPVTGVWPGVCQGLGPLNHIWQLRKSGSRPDALLLLFCCRSLAVVGDWHRGRSRMPRPSLLLPHLGSRGSLVLWVVPDAPCFCFADAVRWVSKERRQALSNCRGAAAKEEGGASGSAHTSGLPQLPGCGSKRGQQGIRERPGLSLVSRADTGGKAQATAGPKPP